MKHHPTSTALLAALLLVGGSADSVSAQSTPPINPNEDSPIEELGEDADSGDDLGNVGNTISDTTDEIDGIVENTTGDIDAAIEDSLSTVEDTIGETTGDLLDEGEPLDGVSDTVSDAFSAFDSISDSVSSLLDSFSSIFDISRLMDVFSMDILDIFEDPLGGLAGSGGDDGGGDSVEITTGALGLPDPKQIEEEIEGARPSAFEEAAGTKTGGEGSPVIKLDLITQFERNLTDEVADQTALTEDGQQKLKENAEAARTALETSQEMAADSEGQDVSQNVLRNISTQLAAQQQTGTLSTVDNQLRARDDALRNKMLVDAVREMQGERMQDRRQDASAYSDAITQGGQLMLPGVGIDPDGGD